MGIIKYEGGCQVADVSFIWDKDKNRINHQKHNVWFDEAVTVFDDVNVKFFADEAHSDDEERFIAIGLSNFPRLLMVCHCYLGEDAVIRLISARKADKYETQLYGGQI